MGSIELVWNLFQIDEPEALLSILYCQPIWSAKRFDVVFNRRKVDFGSDCIKNCKNDSENENKIDINSKNKYDNITDSNESFHFLILILGILFDV